MVATDGKASQKADGFDNGANLYPCLGFCLPDLLQFSYSCYPKYPDCCGAICESSICCIESSLMCCKPTSGRTDHHFVVMKNEQHCLRWSAIHSVIKGRFQCFCIDLRAACPTLGYDEEVPCMCTIMGGTCCFAGDPDFSCCLTQAQIAAKSPSFFVSRVQGSAIRNAHGYFMTALPDGRMQWLATTVGPNERFTAEKSPKNEYKVAIKSDATGRYLCNESSGFWSISRDAVGEWEEFSPYTDHEGNIGLKGHKGFMSTPPGPQENATGECTFSRDDQEEFEQYTIWS